MLTFFLASLSKYIVLTFDSNIASTNIVQGCPYAGASNVEVSELYPLVKCVQSS